MLYTECLITPKGHIKKECEGKVTRWIPVTEEEDKRCLRIIFNSFKDEWNEVKREFEEVYGCKFSMWRTVLLHYNTLINMMSKEEFVENNIGDDDSDERKESLIEQYDSLISKSEPVTYSTSKTE
jgi:hypothetical protein